MKRHGQGIFIEIILFKHSLKIFLTVERKKDRKEDNTRNAFENYRYAHCTWTIMIIINNWAIAEIYGVIHSFLKSSLNSMCLHVASASEHFEGTKLGNTGKCKYSFLKL